MDTKKIFILAICVMLVCFGMAPCPATALGMCGVTVMSFGCVEKIAIALGWDLEDWMISFAIHLIKLALLDMIFLWLLIFIDFAVPWL